MNFKFLPVVFILVLFTCGCFNHEPEKESAFAQDKRLDSVAKTAVPRLNIDTIFKFSSAGENYQLMITMDPVETEYGLVDQTTAWLMRNADTLFRKTYEFNYTGEFIQSAEGEYWITLITGGGGSGYSGRLFHIKTGNDAGLIPVMNFSELSYWSISSNGKSVLAFDGIWNMGNPDDDSFEAHFSPHQQSVSVYTLQGDSVYYRDLGLTKGKYDFFEDQDGLSSLKKNEITISNQIKWEEYFRNED